MKRRTEHFQPLEYLFFCGITFAALLLSICVGSVGISPKETLFTIWSALCGEKAEGAAASIILSVRLPRVLCVALSGAGLSIAGAAMQGLLRNPLADGSTLGVSSGASLGAVLSIAFGTSLPFLQRGGSTLLAMVFAFVSLVLIMALAYKLDYSLSTNTIILVGVIFSMFANSLISLVVTFAGKKVKNIMFWTMGSLSGSSYRDAALLGIALLFGSIVIFRYAGELNAFAIGEENARNIGVNVKKVKMILLVVVSALIGVCVSIGGTIGFVGLVTPHMTRMVVGPNHKRLLPASVFSGAVFLLLADLIGRTLLRPLELPIGVVTSFIGALLFVYIFYSTRKVR